MWQMVAEGVGAFLIAFVIGTLVEYLVHRLMHRGHVLGKKHAEHHRDGWGQGWLGEFSDYFLPTLLVIWLGFLYSVAAGIGWALGGFTYAALAAYAHQLQHEYPDLVFWMPRPVHYLHHKHHMWKTNFGILVDWWDHVFGTYKYVEWQRDKPIRSYGLRCFFRISWYGIPEGTVEARSQKVIVPADEKPSEVSEASTPEPATKP